MKSKRYADGSRGYVSLTTVRRNPAKYLGRKASDADHDKARKSSCKHGYRLTDSCSMCP